MRGRIPTGVDRVALAYLRHYGRHSLAFIRDGRFHVVLPEQLSQHLFQLLLAPPTDFAAHAWRLIARGIASKLRQRDLSGSIFLNIVHQGLEHHRYPELLRRMKVRPVFLVHDLIPLTHAEFCRPGEYEKHSVRMQTVLELAHGVITNSRVTLDALSAFAARHRLPLPPATPAFLAPPAFAAPSVVRPVARPYFIVLSTIEPRKNHLLLLQVWKRLVEQLGEQAPLLVLVGQRGWECENVVDLLERCQSLQGHLLELTRCSDQELVTWLRYAQALLFPSFVEGFGLPLVEALACGTPVIASDLPVFREIAGDVPDYCDPLDGPGWLELIQKYCLADSVERAAQQDRIAGYHVPTWSEHFDRVDALLQQVAG